MAGRAAAALMYAALFSPVPAPEAGAAGAAQAPLPPPRPSNLTDHEAAADVAAPPPRPNDLGQPPSAPRPAQAAAVADESACQERLRTLGVRFEPLAAIGNGACGASHPLKVSHLPDGLDLAAPATMVCPVAEALARWAKEVVLPEAARHLEAQPRRIAVGTSYECRNRNRQATGKLSEHAFANAVDISGFDFEKRKAVQIRDHAAETPEALFQAAIRTQACAYFTTVLGPGSDAAHADHLHLDLRGRSGGYRICQ